MNATAARPEDRPDSTQVRERLSNKYLAMIAQTGRILGLNKKKDNFYRRVFFTIFVPMFISIVAIVMLTLKCPVNTIASVPWKPVWFGGCQFCKTEEHMVNRKCVKNVFVQRTPLSLEV